MRRLWFYLFLSVFAGSTWGHAALIADSSISKVTLFVNQALVVREAKTPVVRGLNTIHLELDAFSVDADSVSAKVFGPGELLRVQYKRLPVADHPQDEVQTLVKEIEALERIHAALTDAQETQHKKQAFLDALLKFSQAQIPKDVQTKMPSRESLGQLMAFVEEGYQATYVTLQDLDQKMKENAKQQQVLQRRLTKLQQPAARDRQLIEVAFKSDSDQVVRIEAQYVAAHAGWRPLYKVAAPDTLDRLDLTLFAKLSQTTGEAWSDVAMQFSNVVPLRGGRLPQISSWYLDLPRPVAKRRAKARANSMAEDMAPAAASPAPQAAMMVEKAAAEPARFAQAVTQQSALSFEYGLPYPISVTSGQDETILPLFTKTITGEFHHLAIPKRSPRTFLVCEAKADQQLLAGTMNVFFGGHYVGKTQLPEKRAGDPFQLNLGADRAVTVSREKVKDKRKETYFGTIDRDNITRQMEYKIKAVSTKSEAVTLDVLDSVPVSRTDRLKITDLVVTPQPTEQNINDRQGVMRWRMNLAPHEPQEISISFTVSYPKGVSLKGL